jgi:hypothetical protein
MGLKDERPPVGVDQGVALAAFDLLAGVIAPGAAGFDGLDTLAVDHRRRGARLSPDPLAIAHDEGMIDGLEQALPTKPKKPAVDRRHRGKALRKHSPCATGPQDVEDAIHNLAHRPLPWPARPRGRRHKRLDDLPLGVRQVASITQMIAAMLPPGGRVPHQALQTGFDNRLESHLSPAIHPYVCTFKTASEDTRNDKRYDFCFRGTTE